MTAGPAEPPRYVLVKEDILGRIRRRELPPGARVPSEHEIVREFGVSRMTANRALRELMSEGIVTRIAGVGSFVARRPLQGEMLEVRSIADEIAARGHRHRCVPILREAVTPSHEVRAALERTDETAVLHTLLLHLEDDRPIQIEDRYVSPEIAPDYLDVPFERQTAHDYLSGIAPIIRFEHVIEAVLPDEPARRMLEIGRTQPCLRLFRRTWSEAGPVTCAWLMHSAAMFALRAMRDVRL